MDTNTQSITFDIKKYKRDLSTPSTLFAILSICALIFGIMLTLFLNSYAGCIFCLGAEILAVIPKTKLKNKIKKDFPDLEKKDFSTALKAADKALKKEMFSYKLSFIMAVVSFIALVAVFACGDYIAEILF